MTNPSTSFDSRARPERAPNQASRRARQAWTIAKIELRRVFFARRSLWVYALALLPSVIFFGHGLDAKFRSERLSPARRDDRGPDGQRPRRRIGRRREEAAGKAGRGTLGGAEPARPAAQRTAGTTTHVIEPTVDARFVRLNVTRPSYSGEPVARIYEFEVYGPDGKVNLALQPPRHWKSAVQPGSGAGEGGERQRGGRPGRQMVRRRLALVPAGGSRSGSAR